MMTYPTTSAVVVPPAGYAGACVPDAVHLPAPYGAREGLLGRKHVIGEAPERTLMRAVVVELATRLTVQEVHTGNGRYTVVVRTGAAFQRVVFSARFVDGFACADYLPRPGVRARMGLGLPAPVVSALYLLWRGEERERALVWLEAHDGAALMAAKVAALPMTNANFWLWDCIRCGVCSVPQVRIRDELCFHCRFAQEAPRPATVAELDALPEAYRNHWLYIDPYLRQKLHAAEHRARKVTQERAPRRPVPAVLPDTLF